MTSNPTKKPLSQYDGQETLRSAHQDENQSFRVTNGNTSIPPSYSRAELTYNSDNSVTEAKFYKGTLPEKRQIVVKGDVSGSLNNTYFRLYDINDDALYIPWFNVSGTGTPPVVADSTLIEVPIETNDSDSIVALALELSLKKLSSFKINRVDNTLTINNVGSGVVTNTTDNGTGFEFTTIQEGSESLIKNILLTDIPGARYVLNQEEKRFEIIPIIEFQGEVDLENPNGIQIINLNITTANSEVSQVLPNNTKKYTLKARDGKSRLKLAFGAGETINNYITVERGFIWDSSNIDIPNSTNIYLSSTVNNVDVEIIAWTRN